MSLIRLGPDTRVAPRYDGPEHPAPRRQILYRCERGHDFPLTFAAGIDPPQTWSCRCGALGHHLADGQVRYPADGLVRQPEHERRTEQLRKRRSLAELEQILADRLAEVAAMREAGRL